MLGSAGFSALPLLGQRSNLSKQPYKMLSFNHVKKEKKTIDTHAHLWDNDYLDQLKKVGSEGTDIAKGMRAGNTSEEMINRIKMMDNAGVRLQVLSATPQSPEYGTEEEAEKMARYINDLYASVMAQFPGRFLAYIALPLPYVDASVRELRRMQGKNGFKGVAINTLIRQKISPADEQFAPLYEELNRLKSLVYIHPTGCGALSPMVQDFDLTWVTGAPIEDLLLPQQLLKAKIPMKYPDITFHFAHLAGGLAFQAQRIEDNFEDWKAFSESPMKHFKNFYYDAANFHGPALQCSCATFGHSQHMMGSDFPYFQDEKYTRAVEYIVKAGFPEDITRQILYGNAERLYGIK